MSKSEEEYTRDWLLLFTNVGIIYINSEKNEKNADFPHLPGDNKPTYLQINILYIPRMSWIL